MFFESHENEVEEEPGGEYPPGDIIEQEGVEEEQGGEYPPGDTKRAWLEQVGFFSRRGFFPHSLSFLISSNDIFFIIILF